jgi:hypothetical protein
VSDQNESGNPDIRPYGAIEEDQAAQEQSRNQEPPRDASYDSLLPPLLTNEPPADYPKAHNLAAGFRSFDPTHYIRKYRTALKAYWSNPDPRGVENREQVLEGQIQQHQQEVVGWKDRLAKRIGSLAPLAGLLGSTGQRATTLLSTLGVIPLLLLAALMLGTCTCCLVSLALLLIRSR